MVERNGRISGKDNSEKSFFFVRFERRIILSWPDKSSAPLLLRYYPFKLYLGSYDPKRTTLDIGIRISDRHPVGVFFALSLLYMAQFQL